MYPCSFSLHEQKRKTIGITNLRCGSNSRCECNYAASVPSSRRIVGLLFLLFFLLALGYVGNSDFQNAQEIQKRLENIEASRSGGAQ